MLELATGKNLLDASDGVTEAVKARLSRRQLQRVNRALRRARLAGWGRAMDAVIWRAATYTPEDVDAVTAKLPELLRMPLCKLLQREPAARYQTAGELAADLRRWHGEAYGKSEAAEELAGVVKDAGEVFVELGLGQPPRDGRSEDDITTR